MKRASGDPSKRRSIFRSLFAPLFLIMILQALIFYFAAVYGGIEESLSQNAADVLNERLLSRKYELETQCNTQWTDWDSCRAALATLDIELGRTQGLTSGANVIMPNLTPSKYREYYAIYPGKAGVSETAERVNAQIQRQIGVMGRIVGRGPGYSPAFRKRIANARASDPN